MIGHSEWESVRKSLQYLLNSQERLSQRMGVDSIIPEKRLVQIAVDDGGENSCGPSDGPSAGITYATSMLSALTKIPVRGDVAMTGTLSQLGHVGEIGGLLHKMSAALQAGATTVIVPRGNINATKTKIIEGRFEIPIPKSLREHLTIIPVSRYEELIPHVFDFKAARLKPKA
jgi:ATP-dependent Lon protease